MHTRAINFCVNTPSINIKRSPNRIPFLICTFAWEQVNARRACMQKVWNIIEFWFSFFLSIQLFLVQYDSVQFVFLHILCFSEDSINTLALFARLLRLHSERHTKSEIRHFIFVFPFLIKTFIWWTHAVVFFHSSRRRFSNVRSASLRTEQ